jgi:probable biosynthetic protein (TIGR04098 family)
MDPQVVGEAVRSVLTSLSKASVADMRDDSTLEALGVDSLSTLILRESLERRFGITIGDGDVGAMLDIRSIVRTILTKLDGRSASPGSVGTATPERRATGGSSLDAGGVLWTDLEIGMPLTGINNLAESALLREIGHVRWQHMTALTGVRSRDVVDEGGARLYPTFFFAEVVFPRDRPMASFKENDAFSVASTLRSYGRALLDGEHYLFPREWPDADKRVPAEPSEVTARKVPYLRLSNSFVQKWQGTEWLKRSRPTGDGFGRIPEVAEAPDSYAELMRVKDGGQSLLPLPKVVVPLSPAPITVPYSIIRDRDLNGAGLLYFANYPAFLDIGERTALGSLDVPGFTGEVLDKRTVVHRRSAYLGNAGVDDVLDISVRPYLFNPLLVDRASADMAPVRLLLEYRMSRRSDGRLIMVSSAIKVLMGIPMGETPLLGWLEKRAGAARG